MSRKRLVMNYVPQGSVLGWFNSFFSDTESEIECTLCKSDNDTKLSSLVDIREGWDTIQGKANEMEKQAQRTS